MHSLTPILILLVSLACGAPAAPTFVEEQPPGSETWVERAALPDWVAQPPARDGHLRFLATGMSNVRPVATSDSRPLADRAAAATISGTLEPLTGSDIAESVATDAAARLTLVGRACQEEVLTRDPVPGNTLCTAWALWEIAIPGIVAALPADVRQAATEALAQVPVTVPP